MYTYLTTSLSPSLSLVTPGVAVHTKGAARRVWRKTAARRTWAEASRSVAAASRAKCNAYRAAFFAAHRCPTGLWHRHHHLHRLRHDHCHDRSKRDRHHYCFFASLGAHSASSSAAAPRSPTRALGPTQPPPAAATECVGTEYADHECVVVSEFFHRLLCLSIYPPALAPANSCLFAAVDTTLAPAATRHVPGISSPPYPPYLPLPPPTYPCPPLPAPASTYPPLAPPA